MHHGWLAFDVMHKGMAHSRFTACKNYVSSILQVSLSMALNDKLHSCEATRCKDTFAFCQSSFFLSTIEVSVATISPFLAAHTEVIT